jgi:alkaline phosphatase D
MTFPLDRRSLIQAGLFGIGALGVPGCASALLTARGFTHDVASGEPRQHSVLLWTRYVPAAGDTARLHWEVSATPDFARIAASGDALSEAQHDHTVKPVVTGLAPGQWYYYRFRDGRGAVSPVGRTRTLPDGPVDRFKLALFSCSNIGFGWFNAYAHAAARDDLDLAIHVGDYLYEYERGGYPGLSEMVRDVPPRTELLHLADYRTRYAANRSDPDLQALHRRLPMIAMWDDHESANDCWVGGAENHQPATEGPWPARKAAAMRAYREWMPVSDATWEAYEVGDLATIFRPETRLTARSHQLDLGPVTKGQADLDAALIRFRDHDWLASSRTLMGAEQEGWLADGFKRSTGRGAKWQVLAQQVVMGSLALPSEAADWLRPDASADARDNTRTGLAASNLGLPFNFDSWDGYPAARRRLFEAAIDANANLVVLSGDSHNAWGFDLDLTGTPVGVEFAGTSVTSPGYETDGLAVSAVDLARALVARNAQLQWAETSRRGYVAVELTPARASGEWLLLDTVRRRSTRLAATHRMSAALGGRRLTA